MSRVEVKEKLSFRYMYKISQETHLMKVVSGAPQVKAFEKCYGLSAASL